MPDILLNEIIKFANLPKFGKTEEDIIHLGLDVYSSILGFKTASLYYLGEEGLEFQLKLTIPDKSETESNKIFQCLVENGGIPSALNSGEITKWQLNQENTETTNFLIIPLVTQIGILGIIVISLCSEMNEEKLLDFCRTHSSYYASVIFNYNLMHTVNRLKEISEQKIALKTKDIVQSTRELKKILDSVQVGIVIYEKATFQITDLNLAGAKLIGKSKEELIGSLRQDHFLFTKNKSLLGEFLSQQEGLLKRNNGSLIPVLTTIDNILIGDQDYLIESFVDISERKRMEEALQAAHYQLELRVEERTLQLSQSNEKLQAEIIERTKAEEQLLKLYWAVEQSPNPVIIFNTSGIIEYVNSSFSRITGYKFGEAVGSGPKILQNNESDSDIYETIWDTISNGNEWKGEFIHRKKNGELYWASTTISPIRNVNDVIINYLSVQEDITERKRFEKEILSAKEKAEESDKLKTTLLANMSHEFRTPLIGILGFSQILADIIIEPDQKEMIEDIEFSGKRLLTTLDGVLILTQLESKEYKLNICRTNLSELIISTLPSFVKLAKAKGLEFNTQIRDENVFSEIDFTLIQKALNNLIDNAIKFTRVGCISVELDNIVKEDKKWAQIIIKDTGAGIELKYQEVIFEAFRQASEGYTRDFEGMGIGLTISKKIVEMFGGQITVKSKPQIGTEFIVIVPASYN